MRQCNGCILVEFDPSAEVSSQVVHPPLLITGFLISADLEDIANFTIWQLRNLADGQYRHTTVDVHFGTPEVHEVVGAFDRADHFSNSTG